LGLVIALLVWLFYKGNLFPNGSTAFLWGVARPILDRPRLSGYKVIAEEPLLADQHARIRDVRIRPEGAVYVLSDNDMLFKLTPK
jgi:aldose sugar dehydrogenase